MLYIISTPIGNLEDITYRAVKTLKEVDLIASEDTRHSKILLKKYEIKTPLESFHSHSNTAKVTQLINILKEGKNIALISDAGTPGISDPGYILIKEAIANKIKVTPIPGPAAFLTALQASGESINKFTYLGFLPLKKGRQKKLQELKEDPNVIVFYESTHRILKTLKELEQTIQDRKIVIARELTKLHEEFFQGTSKEAHEHFTKKTPKGEFVIIISAKTQQKNKKHNKYKQKT